MLTHETYYTPSNTAISNSKVGDYLKSKEFYFRKHVAHEISTTTTAAMKIGKIVDALVTGEPLPYQAKVLKKDNPELFARQKDMDEDSFVSQGQWEEAQQRAQAITKEPFYQWYMDNKAEFQVILEGTVEDMLDEIPVCGMADVVTETADTIYLDDIKSVAWTKCRTATHWYWNCVSMGYFRQMAVYAQLLIGQGRLKIGEKKLVVRHVVVSKESENLYRVKLFIIPNEILIPYWEQFADTVRAISHEKFYLDPPIAWPDAETLKLPESPGLIYVDSDDE